MQQLPHFVPAFPHDLKPAVRDGSQFTWMFSHPGFDRWLALNSTVESQQQVCSLSLHFLHTLLIRSPCSPGTPPDSQSLPLSLPDVSMRRSQASAGRN